jgi:hypothetical protein
MRLARFPAGLVAALALSLLFASPSVARSAHAHRAAAKPTIVLVHGAWADGSSWSRVADFTMEYGLVLPHPGGESEWFAANADALDGIEGTGL